MRKWNCEKCDYVEGSDAFIKRQRENDDSTYIVKIRIGQKCQRNAIVSFTRNGHIVRRCTKHIKST